MSIVNILISILFFQSSLYASSLNKKQKLNQPVNLAVSFEILNTNQESLSTISFDGPLRTLISGNSVNLTDFKCECLGQFDKVINKSKDYLVVHLEFNCGQNNQLTKSKIGRLLIPVDTYKEFSKKIFLHKDKAQAVLKIKELSL